MRNPIKYIKSKLFPKKPTGSLPVDHVYTFETGERLYTYKPEDYQKIHSRYYKGVQEASNYIQTFLMTKESWRLSVKKAIENIEFALTAKVEKSRTKALTDVLMMLNDFERKASGLKNADQALAEELFCMFYLIDDERATGYSEKHNARKIDLLQSDPIMADFFLTNLKQNLKDYWPISVESSETVLMEMIRQKQKMYSDLQRTSQAQMHSSQNISE